MLTPDEIRRLLQDRKLLTVAERTGVGYSTLLRFMRGESYPHASNLIKLSRYLEQN